MRLSGKFSHDPRDQRVLQFNAVFRELEPEDRTYVGTSSGYRSCVDENYDADVIKYSFPENYSIYGVEIELTRVLSPYLLSVYLPSAMFVSMSWVSERYLISSYVPYERYTYLP